MLQNLDSANDTNDDECDAEDNGAEAEDLDADPIQMKTLRSTASTHDDWLHRGPYLNDMSFPTYTEYIDRARRPRKAPPDHQLFEYEEHYTLSRTYCQQITTPAHLPVLEPLKFAAPGEGKIEDNALYKHLVASLTRCTCADGCFDLMLMKPFLLPMSSASKPA